MILDGVYRKKGNYIILNQLRYKGKNYNSIKKEVIDSISARTLDHRLEELTDIEVLRRELSEEMVPIKKKYSLTSKGIILLTFFEVLKQMFNNELKTSDFLDKFEDELEQNKNLNFGNVWNNFSKSIKKKEVIYTIRKEKPNKILKIERAGITVETDKGLDEISYENIENAWYSLVTKGFLQQQNHKDATYRSSFILTLFSQLPYVKVDEKGPLTIRLQNKSRDLT